MERDGRSDDVGIRLGAVEQLVLVRDLRCDGRGEVEILLGLRLGGRPLERAPGPCPRALHHVAGAAQDRARRCSADEQEARQQKRAADDRGARVADERGERAADREPDEAARVLAQQGHEAEEPDPHAEPEGTDVEQVAAREQQPSERDQRDRQDVGGASHDVREHSGEPGADGATVEAEIQDRREDEPEREQGEPEQLVLVGRARSLRPLLHA